MMMDRTKVSVPHKVRINDAREAEAELEIRSVCDVCKGSGVDYYNWPGEDMDCSICNGTGYDNNRS